MAFLWRHKFLSLIVIFLFYYWFYNPEGSFGIARKGFVVYNRIPVAFFDLYVYSSGKIAIEGDLSKSENVKYWYDKHLSGEKNENKGELTLLVGTGFDPTSFKLDQEIISNLRDRRIVVSQMPSLRAIEKYKEMKMEGKVVAVLLKVI
ncbi:MAG TPA: Mth938-like domain-containing protein [Chitinispirillaceae bacterium]|jgi:hypothetical protein|nr:Mth938-like domain-containing protein [Chitinispirillaceae bacterium]